VLNYLIFLGRVPGTNFQITFNDLLFVLDLVLMLYLLRRRRVVHELKYYWIYLHFYILSKKTRRLRLPVLPKLTERTS